ncbi:MAG: IS5 family transposase [Ferruginibacter sp.]
MQGKPLKEVRKRAVTPQYVSPNQLTICGFETPFSQALSSENRWVKLSGLIPWDKIVTQYDKQFKSNEGRPPISGRIVLGAVIIKHLLSLTDRETILQIEENVFMQYFLGYSSFTNEAPFSPSLFVEIRERLSLGIVNSISDIIVAHGFELEQKSNPLSKEKNNDDTLSTTNKENNEAEKPVEAISSLTEKTSLPNQGKLLMDATVAPQNITFPTDLKLLNEAREKSEQLIDKLYQPILHGKIKVRTYRNIARKAFLNTAKKKSKTNKEIYKANGSQLRYLKRNLGHINDLKAAYVSNGLAIPLKQREEEYITVMTIVYEQQSAMHQTRTKSIPNRIVNLHQRYVRPIVRGKEGKKVEFGSKLQVSLSNGYTFLDRLSWDNFNEGSCLMSSVENYKNRFGYYPAEVLADKIYCTRENRRQLKELHIELRAKPLGRPPKQAQSNLVSPGERNPIEGKIGQSKVGYGLDNIKAKLQTTSESWIASIILVVNLVNLTRLITFCLNFIIILFYTGIFGRKKWRLSF